MIGLIFFKFAGESVLPPGFQGQAEERFGKIF